MKSYKTIGIILIVLLLLGLLINLSSEREVRWDKNFSTEEKSPYGLYVFSKEAPSLFKNKLKNVETSPYNFYDKNTKIKPHNILVVECELDDLSWKKILEQVSKGSDAMVFAEEFPQMLQNSLEIEHRPFNYGETSNIYLTDEKTAYDSLVVDKDQSHGIFSKINLDKTEILGEEYYETSEDFAVSSAANFIKVKFGKGHFYLHSEPLIITNYYILKKENQNYIQDVFSFLPERQTYWFHSAYGENSSSWFPLLDFILSRPGLRNAWYIFVFSILLFIIFNAKRKQRIVPIIEPLKNKSVEFIRTIGNLYMQEGDFHDMMAKKSQYFLSKIRTELLIDTQNLDEEFEKKLQLKTGKSPEIIKKAVILIKKSLNPSSQVIKDDLITLNKTLNEILK